MFVVNEDNSIYVTRGDTGVFSVTATENGSKHIFKAGDVLRLSVVEKKAYENVVLQKDFGVEEATEIVDILLTEQDTKIGDTISKPVDYWYEIELNPDTNPQTIIGYDDDGAKIFKLFPEGDDADESTGGDGSVPGGDGDSTEGGSYVIDTELSLTSERAVQNKVIARAVVGLSEEIDGVEGKVQNTLNNFTRMTRKELLELIEEAIDLGEIKNFDIGAVSKITEQNKGLDLTFWIGTQAEFDAVETVKRNCFYLITDDKTKAEIEQKFKNMQTVIDALNTAFENMQSEFKTMQGDIKDMKEKPNAFNVVLFEGEATQGATINLDLSKHSLFVITVPMTLADISIVCSTTKTVTGWKVLEGTGTYTTNNGNTVYCRVSLLQNSETTAIVQFAEWSETADFKSNVDVKVTKIVGMM